MSKEKIVRKIVKENNLQVNWSDERSKLVETFTSNVLKNEIIPILDEINL